MGPLALTAPSGLPATGDGSALPLPLCGRGIEREGGHGFPKQSSGLRPLLGLWPPAEADSLFARGNTVGAADGTAPEPHPPPQPSSLGEGGGRCSPPPAWREGDTGGGRCDALSVFQRAFLHARERGSPSSGEPCREARPCLGPPEPAGATGEPLPSPDRAPSRGTLHPNPPPSEREEGGPAPPAWREGDTGGGRLVPSDAGIRFEAVAGRLATGKGRLALRENEHRRSRRRDRPTAAPSTPTLLPRRGRREGLPLPPGGRGIQGEGGWCLPRRASGLRPWLGGWPRAKACFTVAGPHRTRSEPPSAQPATAPSTPALLARRGRSGAALSIVPLRCSVRESRSPRWGEPCLRSMESIPSQRRGVSEASRPLESAGCPQTFRLATQSGGVGKASRPAGRRSEACGARAPGSGSYGLGKGGGRSCVWRSRLAGREPGAIRRGQGSAIRRGSRGAPRRRRPDGDLERVRIAVRVCRLGNAAGRLGAWRSRMAGREPGAIRRGQGSAIRRGSRGAPRRRRPHGDPRQARAVVRICRPTRRPATPAGGGGAPREGPRQPKPAIGAHPPSAKRNPSRPVALCLRT